MEIHWVPEYIGVAENEKTDKAAKEVAEKSATRRCSERYASLAHVGQTIMERKWKCANYWFKSRHDK